MSHCYCLWFISYPAYVHTHPNKLDALKVGLAVMKKMHEAKLVFIDQVCEHGEAGEGIRCFLSYISDSYRSVVLVECLCVCVCVCVYTCACACVCGHVCVFISVYERAYNSTGKCLLQIWHCAQYTAVKSARGTFPDGGMQVYL